MDFLYTEKRKVGFRSDSASPANSHTIVAVIDLNVINRNACNVYSLANSDLDVSCFYLTFVAKVIRDVVG